MICSFDIGDVEVMDLYPILHDIPWLMHVELQTSMTEKGIAAMRGEFPECVVTVLKGKIL
jgi:hypothetical protein